MNDRELSLSLGYPKNWLAEAKHRDPRKYKIMKRMGILRYQEYCRLLRMSLGDMYWEIKESNNMTMSELYEEYLTDTFANKHAFIRYINHMSFNISSPNCQLKAIKKMQKALKSYKKYRTRKENE